MRLDISCARARLSSRLTFANRVSCNRLRTTTTAPTIDVTPRTCFPLIPSRMATASHEDTKTRSVASSCSLLRFLSQSQLVQLVVQRLQADAEDLRGARLVVARVFERHHDQPALGFLDGRAWAERDLRLMLGRRIGG